MHEKSKETEDKTDSSECKSAKKSATSSMKKGIYLIPNLCTLANLFCGFYAIIATLNGKYVQAGEVILLSMVFDALDGKLARLTNTMSSFGVEFDSLADLVSFGVAPSILMYKWALYSYGRIGWLATFLYLACGAMRLARFNVMTDSEEKRYFTGLPIPAAAALLASFVILHSFLFGPAGSKPPIIAGIAYVLAFLMVSNIKYRSFKDLDLSQKKPFNILVTVLLVLTVIMAEPQISLFLLFASYPASGIIARFPIHRGLLAIYKKV